MFSRAFDFHFPIFSFFLSIFFLFMGRSSRLRKVTDVAKGPFLMVRTAHHINAINSESRSVKEKLCRLGGTFDRDKAWEASRREEGRQHDRVPYIEDRMKLTNSLLSPLSFIYSFLSCILEGKGLSSVRSNRYISPPQHPPIPLLMKEMSGMHVAQVHVVCRVCKVNR